MSRQAGTQNREIEIVPEMIKAGIEAYADWMPDDFSWLDTEGEMVAQVFRAMIAAQNHQQTREADQ